MLPALVAVLLAQTQPAPPPPSVAILVSRRIDVSAAQARQIVDNLAAILVDAKVELLEPPGKSVERLAALNVDPVSCEGRRACLADAAKRIGAPFVLGVAVAHIGADLAVGLDVVRSKDALSVFEQTVVIATDDKAQLQKESRRLAEKLALVAPVYVPPPPPQPAYASFTGWSVGVRGDADLLDVPAFVGGPTVEYSARYVGVAAAALLAPHHLGGRLEGRVHPLHFELFEPFAFLGASYVSQSVAPRAGVGVVVRIGPWLRLQLDGAAERFLGANAGSKPTAVLIGGGLSWRF